MKRTIYRKAVCGHCGGSGKTIGYNQRPVTANAVGTCILCNRNRIVEEIVIEETGNEIPFYQNGPFNTFYIPQPLPLTLEERMNKTNQS